MINAKTNLAKIALFAAGTAMVTAPLATAEAQSLRDLENAVKRRQQKKNEWRNIGYGSAAVGLWGLLKGDRTLMFAGAAGALYSAHRYEQDRKSQSKLNRARASYFGRTSFTRNGQRYVRKTVYRNGQKYYQFVRA